MYIKTKNGTPLSEAKKAAEQFVNQCDMTMTSVGMIAFSDRVNIDQLATQSNKDITHAIQRLPIINTGAGNDTDPFDEIYNLLVNAPDKRYAIVLADGRWSRQDEAVRKAKRCHAKEIEMNRLIALSALATVLIIGAAADANCTDHLVTALQWQATGEDHYPAVVRRMDAVKLPARLGKSGQLLRGDIERPGRESLVDGDIDAAKPCIFHAGERE